MVGKILAAPSVELGNKCTVWELEAKKLIKMSLKVLIESPAGFLMDYFTMREQTKVINLTTMNFILSKQSRQCMGHFLAKLFFLDR